MWLVLGVFEGSAQVAAGLLSSRSLKQAVAYLTAISKGE